MTAARTDRRTALGWLGSVVATATLAPVATAGARRTPAQTEGPFYPVDKPPRPGHDLIHAPGGVTAAGTPLALSGRVLDTGGRPLAGVLVEIWQCDNAGIYRHPRAPRHALADAAFAGYGETRSAADGSYRFLTIVPVAYGSRPPHIHVKLKGPEGARLTTQIYPRNVPDGGRGPRALALSLVDGPVAGRRGMSGRFDFIL